MTRTPAHLYFVGGFIASMLVGPFALGDWWRRGEETLSSAQESVGWLVGDDTQGAYVPCVNERGHIWAIMARVQAHEKPEGVFNILFFFAILLQGIRVVHRTRSPKSLRLRKNRQEKSTESAEEALFAFDFRLRSEAN